MSLWYSNKISFCLWVMAINLCAWQSTCLLAADSINVADTAVISDTITTDSANGKTGADPSIVEEDLSAKVFLGRCAGCHTVGKGKLTGPDLIGVSIWPDQDLSNAIKKMEKNVGPLKVEIINELVSLLKDGKVKERLKQEQDRASAAVLAQMLPPSAIIGRQLFAGEKPLRKGGMACVSCHSILGEGGSLGPELSGVYIKLGDVALTSAIEQASYKVMDAAYRDHPISKQEALHIAKYLSTLQAQTPVTASSSGVPMAGAVIATAFFAGVGVIYRNRNRGIRRKLNRR